MYTACHARQTLAVLGGLRFPGKQFAAVDWLPTLRPQLGMQATKQACGVKVQNSPAQWLVQLTAFERHIPFLVPSCG